MISSRNLRPYLWVLAFATVSSASQASRAGQVKAPLALQGKLASVAGTGPMLKTAQKDYPLTGKTPYLFHTLQDKRLLGRELRLEGTLKPDGTLEVERVYTVRGGKLYRVRYYCEVCNIEALEPGNCVCCQQPTELQELPVTQHDNM